MRIPRVVLSLLGVLLIIYGSTVIFNSTKSTYVPYLIIFIGWILIAFALSLQHDFQNIKDVNVHRLKILIPSIMVVSVSSILLLYNNQHFSAYTLIFAVALYIFGKIGLLTGELGIIDLKSYISIISISIIVIGDIISQILPNKLSKRERIVRNFGRGLFYTGLVLLFINIAFMTDM